MSFLEARKIFGPCIGENNYASVSRKSDTINQENKYRALVEKLIQLEPNDWPNFRSHLKNYTRPNFSKHKFNNKLKTKRNALRFSKKKHVASTTQTRTVKLENILQGNSS